MAQTTFVMSGKGSYDVRAFLPPTEADNIINPEFKDITLVLWRVGFRVTTFNPTKTTFSISNPSEFRFGRIVTTYFDYVTSRDYLNFVNQHTELHGMLPRYSFDAQDDVVILTFGLPPHKSYYADRILWDLYDGVVVEATLSALRSATYYSVGSWV